MLTYQLLHKIRKVLKGMYISHYQNTEAHTHTQVQQRTVKSGHITERLQKTQSIECGFRRQHQDEQPQISITGRVWDSAVPNR